MRHEENGAQCNLVPVGRVMWQHPRKLQAQELIDPPVSLLRVYGREIAKHVQTYLNYSYFPQKGYSRKMSEIVGVT